MVSRAYTGNLCCWKFSQFTCYLVAFIGGVIASATLGTVVQKFDGRCPLFTRTVLVWDKCQTANCSIHVVGGDDPSQWEAKETCDFTIFTAVGAAIYAFISAYFILVCDRTERISQGSGSRNRMTSLFFPLLLTSVVFAILMLVTSVEVLNGTKIFCGALYSSLTMTCSEAQFYKWKEFASVDYFYTILLTGLISSWVSAWAFIISVLILILRCSLGVDFNVVYAGKLVSSQDKSSSKDYGSAGHSAAIMIEKTSSLPTMEDYEPKPGPSSSSI